jgi:hypothetical protein
MLASERAIGILFGVALFTISAKLISTKKKTGNKKN